MEGYDSENGRKHKALTLWGVCAAVLLGPPALVWVVRGAAYAAHCAPGPGLCHGMALGEGLRDSLLLTWVVNSNSVLLVGIPLVATLAAFWAHRVLLGTLSMLLMPIVAPLIPTLAVYFSKYSGCAVSADGIGGCTLWGANMGMSFHAAAAIPDVIYGIVPFTFALTLMLGLLGLFFARQRRTPKARTFAEQMNMRRIGEQ